MSAWVKSRRNPSWPGLASPTTAITCAAVREAVAVRAALRY